MGNSFQRMVKGRWGDLSRKLGVDESQSEKVFQASSASVGPIYGTLSTANAGPLVDNHRMFVNMTKMLVVHRRLWHALWRFMIFSF